MGAAVDVKDNTGRIVLAFAVTFTSALNTETLILNWRLSDGDIANALAKGLARKAVMLPQLDGRRGGKCLNRKRAKAKSRALEAILKSLGNQNNHDL